MKSSELAELWVWQSGEMRDFIYFLYEYESDPAALRYWEQVIVDVLSSGGRWYTDAGRVTRPAPLYKGYAGR